jgi:hypothetical protein
MCGARQRDLGARGVARNLGACSHFFEQSPAARRATQLVVTVRQMEHRPNALFHLECASEFVTGLGELSLIHERQAFLKQSFSGRSFDWAELSHRSG